MKCGDDIVHCMRIVNGVPSSHVVRSSTCLGSSGPKNMIRQWCELICKLGTSNSMCNPGLVTIGDADTLVIMVVTTA
jgi:hypothetical protein